VKLNLETDTFYLRFYYKYYKSDEILNDSIVYLCRKINQEKFYLDRLVNDKKQWTKVFRIEPAIDTLRINEKYTNRSGKSSFKLIKQNYFIGVPIKEK
jgi:hypothetical protein